MNLSNIFHEAFTDSWIWSTAIASGFTVSMLVLKKIVSYSRNAILKRGVLARQERVIIFSRYPLPGKCKTRLIPLLGERGACLCQLYVTDSLLRKFGHCSSVSVGNERKWCVELRYFGGTPAQLSHWLVPFNAVHDRFATVWRPQDEGDLGQKMAGAFRAAFREGARRVVVVGSDIPDITKEIVQQAFDALPQSDQDAGPGTAQFVLGPALDGGYYLVAAHCSISHKLDELFTGMAWGTGVVREQQINVARSLGIEPVVLPVSLSDLDEPGDFQLIGNGIGCTAADFLSPRCAVVMPTLNEEQNVEACIRHTVAQAAHPERLDIVVSDGGSTDTTCSKVEALIENSAELCGASLRLVHSTPGRGDQQNNGVAAAGSVRYLAFVHADTRLPVDFDERIVECLGVPGNVLGAFHFQLDCLEPNGPPCSWFFRLQMSMMCRGVRRRVTKYEMPYGDQCLFTTRQAFLRCGGFPSVRLMEDYILVKTMQQFGHVQMAEGAPAVTSARRWLKHGWLRITGLNQLLIIAHALGVQPNTLADVYYGKAKRPVDSKDE